LALLTVVVLYNPYNFKRESTVIDFVDFPKHFCFPFKKMADNPSPDKAAMSDDEPLQLKKTKLKAKQSESLRRVPSNESDSSINSRSGIKEPDPNCPCNLVMKGNSVKSCSQCGGYFRGVLKIVQEKAFVSQELLTTRQKLETVMAHEENQMREILQLEKELRGKNEALELKNDHIVSLKEEIEILGQKILDEIEQKEQIQKSKDAVGLELENLTQSLFEEANELVAKEARERHGAQQQVVVLNKKINEISTHLQVEQKTSSQLRLRLAQLQKEFDDLRIETEAKSSTDKPILEVATTSKPHIDSRLFSHFEEFYNQATILRASKLHSLLYLKNALEDDVTPCLRFGGNPRTSTKKFIDAIIANNCFIEQMNAEQIQELIDRDERSARASQILREKSETVSTPTVSLFNKTMLEKISNALTPSQKEEEPGGCSTCGRDEEYKFRFKISDVQQDTWYPICLNCRDRILAVVDFYQFVRNIRQGLYPGKKVEELYVYGLGLKQKMFYTRIGASNLYSLDESTMQELEVISGDVFRKTVNSSIVPTPTANKLLA
jgi:ribosomal protein S15P/S13E